MPIFEVKKMSLVDTVSNFTAGKPLIDVMLWHGDNNPAHKYVPYNSSNFYTIQRQLQVYKAAGFSGVRVTDKGLGNKFVHTNAYEMCKQCYLMGLSFCILLDPSVATANSAISKEANFISYINDPLTQFMLTNPNYVTPKFMCDFNTKINWLDPAVASLLQQQSITLLLQHTGFGWRDTPADKMRTCKIPAVFKRFFDGGRVQKDGSINWNLQAWSDTAPTRDNNAMAGQYFYSFCNMINPVANYWSFVSANDMDEGTDEEANLSIETGLKI